MLICLIEGQKNGPPFFFLLGGGKRPLRPPLDPPLILYQRGKYLNVDIELNLEVKYVTPPMQRILPQKNKCHKKIKRKTFPKG